MHAQWTSPTDRCLKKKPLPCNPHAPQRYGYTEVGDRLKRPTMPLWVVASESHFTLLALHHAPRPRACPGAGGTGNRGSTTVGVGDATGTNARRL